MSMENLQDTLEEMLKDLYNAEKQLTKALPKMAKAATTPELKDAIEEHLAVTEGHVNRLEEVFGELDLPVRGKHCAGMEGLIEEGKEVLEMKTESAPEALDAALIAAAQKVEHYEISAYGSARAFAELLGHERVAQLLEQTLDEESETNETLTRIAEETVNPAAMQGDGMQEYGNEEENESMQGRMQSQRNRMPGNGGRMQSNGGRMQSQGRMHSQGRMQSQGRTPQGGRSPGRSQSKKTTRSR
ncbi:MAG TPA: ferritin-like domain-containing protein [bacterium]|nr:ferritin-like domain-containing protein [bacterium]